MEDWGMVAAIVAIVTIPLYASPYLLGPVFGLVRDYILRACYRKSTCQAIRWEDLHDRQYHVVSSHSWLSSFSAVPGDTLPRPRRSSNESLVQFLGMSWAVWVQQVERPRFLRLKTRYLRVDADILTVALMMDDATTTPFGSPMGTLSTGREDGSFDIRYGRVKGAFRLCEPDGNAYIGKLYGFPNHQTIQPRFQGVSKNDFLAIAKGFPPFYRESFRAHSNVDVDHPVRDLRDASRAGWVVAIGFTSHSPTRMYNTRFSAEYENACSRVLDVLQTILSAEFAYHRVFGPILSAAVEGIAAMNMYKTGSVLKKGTSQTVFNGTDNDKIGMHLNVGQIRLILNIFNDYSKDQLSDDEFNELQVSLPEALKAAVNVVYSWWHYVNNEGCAIPEWSLNDTMRLRPIWIEDIKED